MSDDIPHFRLVHFSSYKMSEIYLHGMEQEITVTGGKAYKPSISIIRRVGMKTATEIHAELEAPSYVTVLSAHAWYEKGSVPEITGTRRGRVAEPRLAISEIREVGARSLLLEDTCNSAKITAMLRPYARHGSYLAGTRSACDGVIYCRDSVAVLSAIIRELCYTNTGEPDLSPAGIRKAILTVNALVRARREFRATAGYAEVSQPEWPEVEFTRC
jgi:hypothetical protein